MSANIAELRKALRDQKLLVGYAAALATVEIAEAVVAGTMSPADALVAIGKKYPNHEGLRKQLAAAASSERPAEQPEPETKPAVSRQVRRNIVRKVAKAEQKHDGAALAALRTIMTQLGFDPEDLARVDEYKAQIAALRDQLEAAKAERDAAKAEAAKKAAEQPKAEKKADKPKQPTNTLAWTNNLKMQRADGQCAWGVDPNFTPSDVILDAMTYIKANLAVFLVGPAGSGKTMGLRWICKHLKRKMIVVSMHGHIMADTLEGSSWLDVEDGVNVMKWSPAVLEIAMKEGAVLIFDELDRAPIAIQHLLNGVAETGSLSFRQGPFAGQTLYAAPGFMILGTGNTIAGSNGQYESNGMESSTLSRFRCLVVDYDTAAEARLLKAAGIDEQTADAIQRAIAGVRKEFIAMQLLRPTGTRHIKKLAEDIKLGFSPMKAWTYNVTNLQHEQPTHPAWILAQEIGERHLAGLTQQTA